MSAKPHQPPGQDRVLTCRVPEGYRVVPIVEMTGADYVSIEAWTQIAADLFAPTLPCDCQACRKVRSDSAVTRATQPRWLTRRHLPIGFRLP